MSFIETIFENLERHPVKAFVTEMRGDSPVGVTGADLLEWITHGRAALRAAGVSAGDRVVLLAPNSARWVAADLAILAEGAIVVPMYARQAMTECVQMMHDAEPRLVVVADDATRSAVNAEWAHAPVTTLAELFSHEGTVESPPRPRHSDDVVTIIYTSGTSGEPKGVMLTAGNIDYMLPITGDALSRMMGPRDYDDRVFHYLPFCFAGSRIVLFTTLYRGSGIAISTSLDDLKQELLAARPHYFLNVPTLLERIKNGVETKVRGNNRAVVTLYEAAVAAYRRQCERRPRAGDAFALGLARRVIFKKIRDGIGTELECLISGSAPLGEDTQRWFEMLGIPVYQVYGLTETTAIVTMDEPRRCVPGRVGYPIDGTETKISEDGELLVKGPNIFAGYWRKPDATRAAFEDEWFKTGDQVEVDDNGNYRIVGRLKNILVPTTGHNVAPEPLEQRILERTPGAEHVVVMGHGKPFLTAVVSGHVRRDDVQRVLDELNRELPPYRRIRAFHLTDELFTPDNGLLTANQKLRRSALEARFKDEVEKLYA